MLYAMESNAKDNFSIKVVSAENVDKKNSI